MWLVLFHDVDDSEDDHDHDGNGDEDIEDDEEGGDDGHVNDGIQMAPICCPLEMRQARSIVCSLIMTMIIIISLSCHHQASSMMIHHLPPSGYEAG